MELRPEKAFYVCYLIWFVIAKAKSSQLKQSCIESDLFPCMDGIQCVSKSSLCDGEPDCHDSSDELICADGANRCDKSEFQCHDGECIPKEWVRDGGPADCEDGSDEIDAVKYCQDKKDGFLCRNEDQCISISGLCDSVQHCLDGSDEGDACVSACKSHKCSHLCIPTPSGGTCSCPPGYNLINGTVCLDIDECSAEEKKVCQQLCINADGSFHCDCQEGYHLQADQQSCLKTENHTELLLEGTLRLIAAGPLGIFAVKVQYLNAVMTTGHMTGSSQLLLARDVDALAFDPVKNRIIFHDIMKTTIRSVSLKTRDSDMTIKDLYSEVMQLEGLAVDAGAQNLYWTSYLGFLYVGKLDGSVSTALIKEGLHKPRGIAVDSEQRLLYLTEWGQNSKIQQCHLDGTECVTVVSLSGHPNFIVIEPVYKSMERRNRKKTLYWTDSKQDLIGSVVAGKTVVSEIRLNNARNPHPFGLTLSRDVIFYTDLNTYRLHAIMKSNLSAIYDLELDIGSLYDVLVIDKDQKLPAKSGCFGDTGGCSHLCFPKPHGHLTCGCPDNMYLGADDKTCKDENLPTSTTESVKNERLKANSSSEREQDLLIETANDSILKNLKTNQNLEKEDLLPGKKVKKKVVKTENKLWIIGVVLGAVAVILMAVFLTLFYNRKIKGRKLPLIELIRYNKNKASEDFQELVPNEVGTKTDHNLNELEYVECMLRHHPRETSMVSVDSAFTEMRTDVNSSSSIGSFDTQPLI